MSIRADQLATALNDQRNAFRAFLVARVGNDAEAEDILQNGLVKAVQRADDLQDHTKLTAWFYQLLRNAVIDHYRTRAAGRRRDDLLSTEVAGLGEGSATAPPDWERQLCSCLRSVVNTLKPQQAELLRRVELDGESVQVAARVMKMTANNASVALHRARKELRTRLKAFCGACAESACLDCNCRPVAVEPHRSEPVA